MHICPYKFILKNGTVVDSVVDRCPVDGECQNNINADYYCGFSFTRSDNFTYYFNCAKGQPSFPINCLGTQCIQYTTVRPAMITKCNLGGIWIQAGECQGTNCPDDLKCESYYAGEQ